MAEQGGRYTPSVYLSVTDDANRWREGPPQPKQLTNQSKVSWTTPLPKPPLSLRFLFVSLVTDRSAGAVAGVCLGL